MRQALNPSSEISNKEIEEALWYYYYDIPKTVAYLHSMPNISRSRKISADGSWEKYDPQETIKKQKQPSKFDEAAKAAQSKPLGVKNGKIEPFLYCPCERVVLLS